jgi:hypothetical protein
MKKRKHIEKGENGVEPLSKQTSNYPTNRLSDKHHSVSEISRNSSKISKDLKPVHVNSS